jgi:hypothetical protein
MLRDHLSTADERRHDSEENTHLVERVLKLGYAEEAVVSGEGVGETEARWMELALAIDACFLDHRYSGMALTYALLCYLQPSHTDRLCIHEGSASQTFSCTNHMNQTTCRY